MARNKSNDYFEMMAELVVYCKSAADLLKKTLDQFAPHELAGRMKEMHDIEHKADEQKHVLLRKLVKEFITPIEREDIIQLVSFIDDVTDAIEDVLINMYMFGVRSVPQEARQFADLVARMADLQVEQMRELHTYKKPTSLMEKVIEINRLEEDGDALYTKTMHALYSGGGDPIEIMAWKDIYNSLEHCCDTIEEVADAVQGVIMKNT